jgi:hypothetical protein
MNIFSKCINFSKNIFIIFLISCFIIADSFWIGICRSYLSASHDQDVWVWLISLFIYIPSILISILTFSLFIISLFIGFFIHKQLPNATLATYFFELKKIFISLKNIFFKTKLIVCIFILQIIIFIAFILLGIFRLFN